MELLISLISGAVGGNVAGKVLGKLDQGTLINSISGIVGGGLGGQILGMMGAGGAEGMDLSGIISQVAGGEVYSNYAVGYDNVDVPGATGHGIPVGNTPGVLTETTAEMAVALTFAAGRRVTEADRDLGFQDERVKKKWGDITVSLKRDFPSDTLKNPKKGKFDSLPGLDD